MPTCSTPRRGSTTSSCTRTRAQSTASSAAPRHWNSWFDSGRGIALSITVDVAQDTVCPWCRIGKTNLDDALKNYDGEIEVRFHPYFLRPEMPEAGRDFREHMSSIKRYDDIEPLL